jgi:hypothetical protein
MAAITAVQTESWQVALLIAAHNAATEIVAEDRHRGTAANYAEHFAQLYAAMYDAIAAKASPAQR